MSDPGSRDGFGVAWQQSLPGLTALFVALLALLVVTHYYEWWIDMATAGELQRGAASLPVPTSRDLARGWYGPRVRGMGVVWITGVYVFAWLCIVIAGLFWWQTVRFIQILNSWRTWQAIVVCAGFSVALFLFGIGLSREFETKDLFIFPSISHFKSAELAFGNGRSIGSFLDAYTCTRDGLLFVLVFYSGALLLVPKTIEDPALVLEMQFRRLRFLLYLGSLMMVVGVFQVAAFWNLFVEFESAAGKLVSDAAVGVRANDLRMIGDSITFSEGAFFSLLLGTACLIPHVLLSKRTKELIRARGLAGPSSYETRARAALLQTYGLTDSTLPPLRAFAAVLGPSLVGLSAGLVGRLLQS